MEEKKKQFQYSKPMKDDTGYLEPAQIERILNVADKERDRLLLLILYQTGRRISEILPQRAEKVRGKDGNMVYTSVKSHGLRPCDVSVIMNELTFIVLKKRDSNVHARNAIPESLIKELTEYIKSNGIGEEEPIFNISRQRAYQIIERLGKKAGIEYVGENGKKLHPHHFRHSFAVQISRTISNPADLIQLKKMLGHSSIQMTMWYVEHFNKAMEKELVKKAFGR